MCISRIIHYFLFEKKYTYEKVTQTVNETNEQYIQTNNNNLNNQETQTENNEIIFNDEWYNLIWNNNINS
jgi:hypothetical protein